MGREFRATGVFISFLILCSFILLIVNLAALLDRPDQSVYVLLASFVPVSIVGMRKDHTFLRKFSLNYKLIISADLILFSLPFLLLFILKSHYHFIPILLLMILVVAYRPIVFSGSSSKGLKLKLISSVNFEWRAGVRQHRFILLLLYTIALILLPFPVISLAVLWFLHFIFISFYQYNEPISFIAAYGQNGRVILFSKIRQALILQAVIQFPVILLYAIFKVGTVLIPVIFFLMLQISMLFTIIAKYAFYRPDSPSGPSKFYQYLSFISFVVPFLIPVPLILSLIWFRKATLNLNQYVTDH